MTRDYCCNPSILDGDTLFFHYSTLKIDLTCLIIIVPKNKIELSSKQWYLFLNLWQLFTLCNGIAALVSLIIFQVYRVSDMELVRVLSSAVDKVSVACLHPSVGRGLAYGTTVENRNLYIIIYFPYCWTLINSSCCRRGNLGFFNDNSNGSNCMIPNFVDGSFLEVRWTAKLLIVLLCFFLFLLYLKSLV